MVAFFSPGTGECKPAESEALAAGCTDSVVGGVLASTFAGGVAWQAASETAQTMAKENKSTVGRDIAGLSILLAVRHNATMKVWKSPIRILLLYLSFLAIWASYNWGGLGLSFLFNQLLHFSLLLLPGWLLYFIFVKVKIARPTRWEHRLISVLILFLLFDVLFPWWVFLAVGLATELLQRLLRVPTGPLANPAAAGAVILSLFGQFPTWWGVNFGPRFDFIPGSMSLLMILTSVVAGYVAWKYHKLPIVACATVAFSVVYFIIFRASSLPILVDGTFAFFLLVMAVEPKTSPAIQQQQLWFGSLLGIMVGALLGAAYKSYWVEPYTSALVFTNVVFNLYRNQKSLLARFAKRSSPPTPVSPQVPPVGSAQ